MHTTFLGLLVALVPSLTTAIGESAVVDRRSAEVSTLDSARIDAKTEVTIAVFDSFSTGNVAAVIRRIKGNSGKLLIAVKRSQLTQERIAHLLRGVHSTDAMRATSSRLDIFFYESRPIPPATPAELGTAAKLVTELLSAVPTEVPGYGKHQSVRLKL